MRLDLSISIRVGKRYEAREKRKLEIPGEEERVDELLKWVHRAPCLSDEERAKLVEVLRNTIQVLAENYEVGLGLNIVITCPSEA